MVRKEISKKLYESIKLRCGESRTGRILVPTDILKKYMVETNFFEKDFARSDIIDITTNISFNAEKDYVRIFN